MTTRQADGTPVGITANSFSSVSLHPPLVLWCIDKSSETFADFQAAEHFAINVLSVEDMVISQDMARTGQHSLEEHVHKKGLAAGMPLIDTALATFECCVEHRHEGGDHVILVGRVLAHTSSDTGLPLLYFRGKYAGISE